MVESCEDCKGRGYFLFPMTSPICDACEGTGLASRGRRPRGRRPIQGKSHCREEVSSDAFHRMGPGLRRWVREHYRFDPAARCWRRAPTKESSGDDTREIPVWV